MHSNALPCDRVEKLDSSSCQYDNVIVSVGNAKSRLATFPILAVADCGIIIIGGRLILLIEKDVHSLPNLYYKLSQYSTTLSHWPANVCVRC